MDFRIGDVIQYYNAENSEGLYCKIYVVYEVLTTVLVVDKGIRILKGNVVKI